MTFYLQAVATGAGTCTVTATATAIASSTGNTCSAQVSLSVVPPPPYTDSFLVLQLRSISRTDLLAASKQVTLQLHSPRRGNRHPVSDLYCLRLVHATFTSLSVCRPVLLPPPPASASPTSAGALQQQWRSPLLRPHPLPRVASVQWPQSLHNLWQLPLQRWVQSPSIGAHPLLCMLSRASLRVIASAPHSRIPNSCSLCHPAQAVLPSTSSAACSRSLPCLSSD